MLIDSMRCIALQVLCYFFNKCRWIPFEKVRALLDKKSYVVLSDYASFQDQASLPSQLNENSICSAPNDPDREGCEGCSSNEDGDMEVNLDSDNDQLEPEAGELNTPNVSDIVLECNGTRVKFKVTVYSISLTSFPSLFTISLAKTFQIGHAKIFQKNSIEGSTTFGATTAKVCKDGGDKACLLHHLSAPVNLKWTSTAPPLFENIYT